MRRNLFLSLFLCTFSWGCDSWFIANPNKCAPEEDSSCPADTECNPVSLHCDPLDCTKDASCNPDERCDSVTRRCLPIPFVLGQPDESTNMNAAYGMFSPQSVALIADGTATRLAVGDAQNHRILIWSDIPAKNRPADLVLGMPSLHTLSGTGAYGGTNNSSVQTPWSMVVRDLRGFVPQPVDTRVLLVVGDQAFNRLLMWDLTSPLTNGSQPLPAVGLWGQDKYEQSMPNDGMALSAYGASSPLVGMDLASKWFMISDSGNNRVLIFSNDAPGIVSKAPDRIIGQAAYAGNKAGAARNQLNNPRGVASGLISSGGTDVRVVFVVEAGNHRVTGYPTGQIPANSGNAPNAYYLLGQATFGAAAENRGLDSVDQTTLSYPQAVAVCKNRVYVADQGNNRVLEFDGGKVFAGRVVPNDQPAAPAAAQLVLGQADVKGSAPNRGSATAAKNTLSAPSDVKCDGMNLVVADTGNHRVLIWRDQSQIQNGSDADVILGQPKPSENEANMPRPDPLRQLWFNQPTDVATDGTMLAVADTGNHRVLLWNSIPSSGNIQPDIILGQPDAVQHAANNDTGSLPSARTLSSPAGVSLANGTLAVSDTGNNRVLIWNLPVGAGIATYAPANTVIGQPNASSSTLGTDPTMATLAEPSGLALADQILYLADTGLNRVLIYSNPFKDGASYGVLLGDTSTKPLSASTLSRPSAVTVHDGKLLVTDRGNQRVLIWNTLPGTSSQPADVVIGQPDSTRIVSSWSAALLTAPSGILVDGSRLFIADVMQNRILYWKTVPVQSGGTSLGGFAQGNADGVIGQADPFSNLPNTPALAEHPVERLSYPGGIVAVGKRLIIADTLNNRIVIRALPPRR